jgi:chemotaxis protein MotA
MDLATVAGIILGFTLIVGAILVDGGIVFFIDVKSLMIVCGGTLAATLISFPLVKVLGVVKVLRNAFLTRSASPMETIHLLVQFAEKARREGILSLETVVNEVDDEFLRNGVRLAVDGVEPDLIKDILHTELAFIEDRHKTGQNIFVTMGTAAPAFGMIGTLIGLVLMLQTLSDPSSIGPGMAMALLTTLYGALLANVVFLPIAEKLRNRTNEEILIKELSIEGIMSIQSGDNPRIVHQKLLAFLAPKARAQGVSTEQEAEAA